MSVLVSAAFAGSLALAQGKPPAAPVGEVSDTYFGRTIVDPYRWMEADTKLVAPAPVDFSGIDATQVMVKSHDGVMVPLSILHKRGLPWSSKRPTLIAGYGAYGISIEPNFGTARLAWLERGGVLAFAHVRGGGE